MHNASATSVTKFHPQIRNKQGDDDVSVESFGLLGMVGLRIVSDSVSLFSGLITLPAHF